MAETLFQTSTLFDQFSIALLCDYVEEWQNNEYLDRSLKMSQRWKSSVTSDCVNSALKSFDKISACNSD